MSIERRELFRIIGAAGAAVPAAGQSPLVTSPRFFSAKEFELLGALCGVILPADEEGGGAVDAEVPRYIDTLVYHSDAANKQFWRSGLAAAAEIHRFDAVETVKSMAAGESAPATQAERFFVRLKAVTIDAFFQSQVGMKYLGYKGNAGSMTFPGCTHDHSEA